MTTPADDRDLLSRAAGGDQAALGALYDRHVRAVYWQALAVTRDAMLAEDVTQEVFLTFWQKVRSVHVVDSSVLPWLMVTARFHALNAGRRMQRERRRSTTLDGVEQGGWAREGADDALVQREIQEGIDAAVAGLSTTDRRIYELCLEGDHSYESAAQMLGLSHASVRNRLSRVRIRLRSDLHALRES
ncbi:RNA polymerase sigma factor [Nocardioides sp. Kera G14]|uniref:RNA polymerase sigma factor n=1 Tax=Nocardioides sp. Kera G14 TaxID=2884264 RepID=UPI001D11BD24|nr:sigma-70 family RNA polymerase sigma factor [Nocardioides sp. Kera G14]UDY25064.1 sigma-70 family RNA polymerase sigma factor [Nocardioides sp. Kera G14]